MPSAPQMPDVVERINQLSMSTTAAVTAASGSIGSSGSDVISLDGSEDSFSGASLVSAPSSDDWEDGRVNVVPAAATTTVNTAPAPRTNVVDYVVLYDDNSSEEGF